VSRGVVKNNEVWRLRWAGHVAGMGRQGMHTKFYQGNVLNSGRLARKRAFLCGFKNGKLMKLTHDHVVWQILELAVLNLHVLLSES
jgi:hypothetical protein